MPAGPALAAWLDAIAALGFHRATADEAARRSGLTVADLHAAVGDRFHAVAALRDRVVAASVAAARSDNGGDSGSDSGSGRHERLFDGLMAGFDCLQEQRPAVLAIWAAHDPRVLALVAGRLPLDLRRLALVAGVPVDGVRGRARLAGLAAILLRSFHHWRRDDSADLSATMAAVDRLLQKAGEIERRGLSAALADWPGLAALSAMARRWRALGDDPAADGD